MTGEPNALPYVCAIRHPTEDRWVLAKKGEQGYWDLPPNIDPARLNESLTETQIKCMELGSIMGVWLTPSEYLRRGKA